MKSERQTVFKEGGAGEQSHRHLSSRRNEQGGHPKNLHNIESTECNCYEKGHCFVTGSDYFVIVRENG